MKIQDNSSHKIFAGKEDIAMGLDLANTSSIMNLLRNNIYTDPIDSIVREYFSNAIDAQARNNSTAAIELDIETKDNKYIFSVRDFGKSMDKKTIANVYAKMGKSDKTNSNEEHGG
jgi:sensor histidine kinase regulating citrate/malate metabolism